MPAPYDAVLFDLDGTLVSERAGVERARACVAALVRENGHNVSDAQYSQAAQNAIDEALAANHGSWPATFSRQEAIRRALVAVNVPTKLALPCEQVYKRERLANLELLPNALEILDPLRQRGPLGLITNGNSDEQRDKIRRCALADYFDPVVISDDLGITKPHPAIFERALAAIGVTAQRAVYIGNSFANDVEGGAAVGLDTIWLDERGAGPPANARHSPTAIIGALRELRPLLDLPPRLGAEGA